MTNNTNFQDKCYIFIKDLIPKDICKITTKYTLLKEKLEFEEEVGPLAQVPNSHSVYGDTLMETLLYFLTPHMEQHTGLSLAPTYSYYRVYRPGNELPRHIDRPSCEISATICLGVNYKHVDKNYNWGIYIDPIGSGNSENNIYIALNNKGIKVEQLPGDVLIYKGCENEHWRDKFTAGVGSYQVQGFFHYVNKNGPFYPECANDRRSTLGYKKLK